MREEIMDLLGRAKAISATVGNNLVEVYEFILQTEGLAVID